jgi:2-polyprenyl-3-methyl-5-hydroxy-6-metoxy-1,4-benzoquinol methylase
MPPTEPVTSAHACWVCASPRTLRWKARGIDRPLRPEDLQITDDRYGVTLGLWRCEACGFLFADRDDLRELVSLYERLADSAYEESQDSRALQMRWLLREIQRAYPTARTLLDIGAGAGLLVSEARKIGLDAMGVEPSASLVASAPRLNGVVLLQGTFPHPMLAGKFFDVVCLVDVIEHVADPRALLRDCGAALSDGGVLVVVTPDVGSAAARWLGPRWWHFRLAHVGYFDRRTLTRAAQLTGLRVDRLFRARWFFRIRYVAQRLAQYLPIGWINRAAERSASLRWVYDRVVPVNPQDSMVVFLRVKPEDAA